MPNWKPESGRVFEVLDMFEKRRKSTAKLSNTNRLVEIRHF